MKYTKEQLEEAIESTTSARQAAQKLNIPFSTFKRYSQKLKIYKTNQGGKTFTRKGPPKLAIDLDKVFKNEIKIGRGKLKSELVRLELLKNECDVCNVPPMWNGKSLNFHLDHINGVNDDNSKSNLRLLCPNCHSQTDTYSGRNTEKAKFKRNWINIPIEKWIDAIQTSYSVKIALGKIGLRYSKEHTDFVDKVILENNINLLKTEYIEDRQNSINDRLIQLRSSNIDFTKHGWVQEASEILKISPQKVSFWVKNHAPEIYNIAFRRKKN